MINEKKQFVLALKGWEYGGVLDRWFYGISDPGGLQNYHGFVFIDGVHLGTYIPGDMIIKKEGTEHMLLFLSDHTYFELGIQNTNQ